jgi:hypothetical protein
MIPLTTITATRPSGNPWLAAVYAGIISAVIAAVFTFLFPNVLVGWILAFLLIGIGPVLGYQFATGQGLDFKSIIGAIVGSILPIIVLWPILVGALTRGQSIGKLILGAIIAVVLGWIVFFIVASAMGQDPGFLPIAFVLYSAVWGGALGAIMTAWRN